MKLQSFYNKVAFAVISWVSGANKRADVKELLRNSGNEDFKKKTQ